MFRRRLGFPSFFLAWFLVPALLMTLPANALGREIRAQDAEGDPWSLWNGETQLRGANIFQRRAYPELDGSEFMGSGVVGPPYTQSDFDDLAALGANYVNISHPGLFSETAPYALDQAVRDHLDGLIDLATNADLFVVISFRTGPGRSEFTFYWGEDGDWFDSSYYDDRVWLDSAAQDAWVAMWQYTAQRYADRRVVVGYDLMVEPNSNEVWFDEWDPAAFYAAHADTLYDWNQLHPRIAQAIRTVNTRTPILVGCMAYSALEWLPYQRVTTDPRTVYTVHQYDPFVYTHQEPSGTYGYPDSFDLDYDGLPDTFDRTWLDELMDTIDEFETLQDVPTAANEYGIKRWVPDGADFMEDQIELFEERGMNHALWAWEPAWEPWAEEVHDFNFRFGPDPAQTSDVSSSELSDVIVEAWGLNTVRPSTFVTQPEECVAGENTLCLNQGRFRVEVAWNASQDRSGSGWVVPFGSDDSGLFWFFHPDNWEMLIKVLDGCGVNQRFWVFMAATTDVGYTVTVTDTANGIVKNYVNTLGTSAPATTDTSAFATCP